MEHSVCDEIKLDVIVTRYMSDRNVEIVKHHDRSQLFEKEITS